MNTKTMDWTWSYLTFERGARLITGPVGLGKPGVKDNGAAKRASA